MNLVRFLSYPVFYDPSSPRAAAYVMEHFYRIRSLTRLRQLRKTLIRPILPFLPMGGRERLADQPGFERIRHCLEERKCEAVVAARRFFRLIDFRRREVVNIFKDNDLTDYFWNEISARKNLSGAVFLPRLIGIDETNRSFVEEYVCERSFKSARLKELDVNEFAGRLKQILRQVRRSAPPRAVPPDEYAGALAEQILCRPEADGDIRRDVDRWRKEARKLETVELVFSHGDLRKDQIFFSPDGSIRVIDWECSGYFSRYYDPAELYLTERWLYANPGLAPEFLLASGRSPLRAVFSLYLLELCSFPIRFRRDFLLTRSLPIIRQVEKRIRRQVLRREGKG